jgi:hypothetical protein
MPLESLWGDIRFAFRIFERSPAVALTVIGTLAVALGLNAAYVSREDEALTTECRCLVARH